MVPETHVALTSIGTEPDAAELLLVFAKMLVERVNAESADTHIMAHYIKEGLSFYCTACGMTQVTASKPHKVDDVHIQLDLQCHNDSCRHCETRIMNNYMLPRINEFFGI